jgi:hypothetical protein
VLMIVVGVLVWGGEAAGGGSDGDSNQAVGMLLSMALIAGGYLLLVRLRHGPLAAAGVVAAAAGVPLLLGFATFDSGFDSSESDAVFAVPFSIDAIVLLSLAAWLATYLWVPVARGRVFFVAISAVTLWLYLLEKVEEGAAAYVVTLPFSAIASSFASAFEEEPQLPDPGTIGGMSLMVGTVYYLVAIVADRSGRKGLTTPFLGAGFVVTAVGVAHVAGDLEAVGTGLLLIALGSVLAVYGATQGRRFTTWAWGAGIGLGVLVVLTDVFEDSAAGYGAAAIECGVGVIYGAHLITDRFSEPDEMVPGPSRFTPRPRPAPGPDRYPTPAAPYGPAPGPAIGGYATAPPGPAIGGYASTPPGPATEGYGPPSGPLPGGFSSPPGDAPWPVGPPFERSGPPVPPGPLVSPVAPSDPPVAPSDPPGPPGPSSDPPVGPAGPPGVS